MSRWHLPLCYRRGSVGPMHWDWILAPCDWALLQGISVRPWPRKRVAADFGGRTLVHHKLAEIDGEQFTITPLGRDLIDRFRPNSAGEIEMVRLARLERAAPASRTQCSTTELQPEKGT